MEKEKKYFYEKRYYRRNDNKVFARRYSRSFEFGQKSERLEPEYPDGVSPNPSNVIEASVSRARSRVRVLAFGNPSLVGLLTLTFSDIPSEEIATQRFNVFRKKVSRHFKGWQFLGVKELQRRGSIHYHLLVNFCPAQVHKPLWNAPLQQQSDLWDYGISDYRLIKGDEHFQTELYLLKYLTKGKQKIFKSYYVRSRNLSEPTVQYIQDRLPYPENAQNLFTTIISNNNVAKFEITEYTYTRLNK